MIVSDLIRTDVGEDGVLLATIDMPGTMNVFSAALMDALDALMDRVDSDSSVTGVVLTSGKQNCFLAGADLTMVRGFTESARTLGPDDLTSLCGRLGRQFVRLEASRKPWVAAVNGLALGGGLELAMACRARIVSDDNGIQVGLPEVRWGLLPGAGGTQRLPRLVGFDRGLELLLTARSLNPTEAVEAGLFGSQAPATQLADVARQLVKTLVGTGYDIASKFAHANAPGVPEYSKEVSRELAQRFSVTDDQFDSYPAYDAIIEAVLKGAHKDLATASAVEMESFLRLMYDPVAGRMVRTLFLERLRAERELAPRDVKITALALGRLSSARAAWAKVLAQTRIPGAEDLTLPVDTVKLTGQNGDIQLVELRILEEPVAPPAEEDRAYIVLAPMGPYGRAVEIVGQGPATSLAAALCQRLRAAPWVTRGPLSILQSMHGQSLAQQARIATTMLDPSADAAFLDVAACLSGVSPAWSGGPLGLNA